MAIRIPPDASINLRNAFNDVADEIKKAGGGGEGGSLREVLLLRKELADLRAQVTSLNYSPSFTEVDGDLYIDGDLVLTGGATSGDSDDDVNGLRIHRHDDQSPNGPHDIYQIPGALAVAGPLQSGSLSAGEITVFDKLVGTVEAHGGTAWSELGLSDTAVLPVWTAPYTCEVIAVRGYQTGGTSVDINAVRNGTDNHLSSDLTVSVDGYPWTDGGAVQNTTYAIGDAMSIEIASITGSPTQIAVQIMVRRT